MVERASNVNLAKSGSAHTVVYKISYLAFVVVSSCGSTSRNTIMAAVKQYWGAASTGSGGVSSETIEALGAGVTDHVWTIEEIVGLLYNVARP